MATTTYTAAEAMDELQLAIADYSALTNTELWITKSASFQAAFPTGEECQAMMRNIHLAKTNVLDITGLDWNEIICQYDTSLQDDEAIRDQISAMKDKISAKFYKADSWRTKYELALAIKRSSSNQSGSNKPMTATAIDQSAPKEWRGQKDNRAISEFLDSVEAFVSVTKCVPAEHQTREITRLTLSLLSGVEGKLVNENFSTWRKSQSDPTNAWADKATLSKWMTESLTNPKTGSAVRSEFNSLTQQKPGLEGLHSYSTKVRQEYSRLKELKLQPDDFTIKLHYRDHLHYSIRTKIPDEIKDSIVEDPAVLPLDFIDSVCNAAVGKMQGTGRLETDGTKSYSFKSKKDFDAAVRLATKGQKGGKGKERNGRKITKEKKKHRVNQATIDKNKHGRPDKKTGDKPKIFEIPDDWKSKMCFTCGGLYHRKDDCFHNKANISKRPSGFKQLTEDELANMKKSRVARYEQSK